MMNEWDLLNLQWRLWLKTGLPLTVIALIFYAIFLWVKK